MRRMLIYVFLLSCLSNVTIAEQRLAAANSALLDQVRLMALAMPHSEFADYELQLMAQGQLSAEQVVRISGHVAQFWLSQGVNTSESTSDDPFTAVIGAEPQVTGYLALSNRIRYLLWLQQQPWPEIAPGVWLTLGDHHPDITAIITRLQALGDYPQQKIEGNHFDERLADAVVSFQARHGLKQDAIIGPATLRWMNLAPIARARLLAKDFIKRTEYLAHVGRRYLLINIPAYEMLLIDNDRVALRSRVIVGKPYRQTPIIKGEIKNLVLNPSWRVPRRLLKYDLLPKVREDGSYISRRNFEVYDYQGERVIKSDEEWRDIAKGQFPYRLVQKPGEGNTLGRYKFFFPNQYSVYLHDTSDKSLFARSERALSSGCIRVEKVEQLANWMASHLVRDKQTWVTMQMERDKTQWFAFDGGLPIHLVYWTSWVDANNVAQFRDDIYNKNQNNDQHLQASR